MECFNTQPPEGGWEANEYGRLSVRVSTHSRLKAAGFTPNIKSAGQYGFNTQPPEGGWSLPFLTCKSVA